MTSPEQSSKPSESQKPSTNQEQPWWLRIWQQNRENLQVVGIALLVALLLRLFVAEPRYIPSDSMMPTLHVGDRLVVEKISYSFHAPKRGDIVVFSPPPQLQKQGFTEDQAFIKRIIGEPGDTIAIHQGTVYLNEQPLAEPYIAAPPRYEMPPTRVPQGSYFVMGDNRNNSNDSHVWGFLPAEDIIGRAWWRFWPPSRIGQVGVVPLYFPLNAHIPQPFTPLQKVLLSRNRLNWQPAIAKVTIKENIRLPG
ncbi:signal peptidase I [Geitlerinema sp. PCC 9228]|jgi:signal peptidase I|uniref:signal peptidase I n=1 Tax=Geitlerinema sp. PCC 9228 TaxID=111611 RepID=UPI0008F98D14